MKVSEHIGGMDFAVVGIIVVTPLNGHKESGRIRQ
jgi:hypothetical protein